jgi:hypothetical protein
MVGPKDLNESFVRSSSPDYALANVDRENGVEDHVILAAHQTYSKFSAR